MCLPPVTLCTLACAALLLMVARHGTDSATTAPDPAVTQDRSWSSIVLRLRTPVDAAAGAGAGESTLALVRCLASHPDMKLRVHVEVDDSGSALVWKGDFVADPRDVLPLAVDAKTAAGPCRELTAAHRARPDADMR